MAKQATLMARASPYTDNQITFCVNNNDHGYSFYQSTYTVDTKHGYHIDASQKTHYVGTTSNLH